MLDAEKLALTINDAAGNPVPIEGVGGIPTGGIGTLSEILKVGVGLLFIIAVFASLAFIIWGGIDWIMSGGNKENIQKARHKFIWAIIGIVVVFLAFFIMNTISQLFGIEFYKLPAGPVIHAPGTGPLEFPE